MVRMSRMFIKPNVRALTVDYQGYRRITSISSITIQVGVEFRLPPRHLIDQQPGGAAAHGPAEIAVTGVKPQIAHGSWPDIGRPVGCCRAETGPIFRAVESDAVAEQLAAGR